MPSRSRGFRPLRPHLLCALFLKGLKADAGPFAMVR